MNIAENIISNRHNIHQKINLKKNRKSSYDAFENDNKKIFKIIGDFKLGEMLGQGTFGKVRLATHILTKEKVFFYLIQKFIQ